MLKCTNVRGHYGRGRHAVPEKGDAKAREILATLKHLYLYFSCISILLVVLFSYYQHLYLYLLDKGCALCKEMLKTFGMLLYLRLYFDLIFVFVFSYVFVIARERRLR